MPTILPIQDITRRWPKEMERNKHTKLKVISRISPWLVGKSCLSLEWSSTVSSSWVTHFLWFGSQPSSCNSLWPFSTFSCHFSWVFRQLSGIQIGKRTSHQELIDQLNSGALWLDWTKYVRQALWDSKRQSLLIV